MFFYFDFDKTIDNGGASTAFNTMPSDALKNGDFSGAGLPTLYDPTSQTIQPTGSYTYTGSQYPNGALTVACPCVVRKSFAQEYGNGNVLPADMISSVAKAIQAYYPAPNTPGQVTSGVAINNFVSSSPNKSPATFDIWREKGVQLQIRGDAINVLNHASFGQPGNNAIGQDQSAQITGTTIGGRNMQLYGRISF
jgi:hypothetical protein